MTTASRLVLPENETLTNHYLPPNPIGLPPDGFCFVFNAVLYPRLIIAQSPEVVSTDLMEKSVPRAQPYQNNHRHVDISAQTQNSIQSSNPLSRCARVQAEIRFRDPSNASPKRLVYLFNPSRTHFNSGAIQTAAAGYQRPRPTDRHYSIY